MNVPKKIINIFILLYKKNCVLYMDLKCYSIKNKWITIYGKINLRKKERDDKHDYAVA